MAESKNIEVILEKIFKKFESRVIVPIEHQLWNEKDIAQYFKYSLDYTKRHIISHYNFPPSRQLPTSADGDRTVRRWKATDVVKFAMAFDKTTLRYS